MTLGGSWPEGLSKLPNARWTLQVPLARKNLSNAVESATTSLMAMHSCTIEAIEIGNEVNLYPGPSLKEFRILTTDAGCHRSRDTHGAGCDPMSHPQW